MPVKEKAHLGRGLAFPVKPVNGGLRYAAYEEDIEQAVQIILMTGRGERVMLNAFGSSARDMLFEPNSAALRARLTADVRKALEDWEPRINIERVEVTEGSEPTLVLVHVDYVVRATNNFYNRVYPFYLLEGRA
jgi:uncharacterized protein